jgi:hypothetical protein
MLSKLMGLMLAAFFSVSAWAGEMGFKIQQDSAGRTQFRLIGNNLCDAGNATSFKMTKGVVTNGYFEGTEQYVSSTGKSEWKINDVRNCSINQQITNDLLVPGKAVKVTTFNSYGSPIESYYLVVPCRKEQLLTETEYRFYTELQLVNASVCSAGGGGVITDVEPGGTVVVPAPAPVEREEQYCRADVEIDKNDLSRLNVMVGCSFQDVLDIEIYVNGSPITSLTKRISSSASTKQFVTSLAGRIRSETVEVKVVMISPDFNYRRNYSETFKKSATFNHEVRAELLSPAQSTAYPNSKAFGRGVYFESKIEVAVNDKDIEEKYPTRDILVQLINTKGGRNALVEEQMVSTGDLVTFYLDGQFVEPLVFGDAYWDENGQLFEGRNTFKVLVFDAYQKVSKKVISDIVIDVVK